MRNGLWFYSIDGTQESSNHEYSYATAHRLTATVWYYLLHERLGHPGKRKMAEIHHHFRDLPKVSTRNIELYDCGSCALEKIRRRHTTTRDITPTAQEPTPTQSLPTYRDFDDDQTEKTHHVTNAEDLPDLIKSRLERLPTAEYRYHMDFGFPRGSTFQDKDTATGHTYTSIDGYRAYLLIILYPQRRAWVFPVKTKQPPVDIVRKFLRQYDTKDNVHRVIRTDQGGEL